MCGEMKRLLQDWVTDQAERHSGAVAVVMRGKQLTYGELEEASNQLARMLRAAGCQRHDRVGLLMPKCPEAIIGVLGILKADCMYVPLDASSPPLRLAKNVGLCEPRVVLSAAAVGGVVDQLVAAAGVHAPFSIGWIDAGAALTNARAEFSAADWRALPDSPPPRQNTPDDPAYILFTSGSTGTPKGVVITHSSVVRFVRWANEYLGADPSDRFSGHSNLHFDLSVYDVFGTFAAGAQLHLVPHELNLLPNKLAEFIRSSGLTQWFSVPSVLHYMAQLDVIAFNDFPQLKRLVWCGEVFPTPALIYWMDRLPHVRFTNLYGPTETTIASSHYTVRQCPRDPRAAIPIGTACRGEELLVLDDDLRPVPPEEIGNIWIRGVGLSPGYWRNPDATSAAFRPVPGSADPRDRMYRTGDLGRVGRDGLVYFVGRADTQIKTRGYRVELGEIETALHATEALGECAVVAIASESFEGAVICCAYVPAPGANVTPVVLRKALARVLPAHMLPSRWAAADKLPRNANGKIDLRRLQEQFQADEVKVAH
jgi:amino acid adenylation domain-containing protein